MIAAASEGDVVAGHARGQRAAAAGRRAAGSLVWLAASVDRIARPSEPPTCWAVLNSPEASPASSPLTPPVPSSVIGTKVRPMPMLIGISPTSRLPT